MFDENKAVVQRWLDMVSGNREGVWESYKTLDPAMTWTLIGSTAISGTWRGLNEINDGFQHRCWHGDGRGSGVQGLDPGYGIKPLKIEEVVALEDGRVLVHCFSDGKGKNGVPYKNEYCWIIAVNNGRIVSMYEFADTVVIERAIFDKQIIPSENVR